MRFVKNGWCQWCNAEQNKKEAIYDNCHLRTKKMSKNFQEGSRRSLTNLYKIFDSPKKEHTIALLQPPQRSYNKLWIKLKQHQLALDLFRGHSQRTSGWPRGRGGSAKYLRLIVIRVLFYCFIWTQGGRGV